MSLLFICTLAAAEAIPSLWNLFCRSALTVQTGLNRNGIHLLLALPRLLQRIEFLVPRWDRPHWDGRLLLLRSVVCSRSSFSLYVSGAARQARLTRATPIAPCRFPRPPERGRRRHRAALFAHNGHRVSGEINNFMIGETKTICATIQQNLLPGKACAPRQLPKLPPFHHAASQGTEAPWEAYEVRTAAAIMAVLLPIYMALIFAIEVRVLLSMLQEEKAKRLEESLILAGLPTWCGWCWLFLWGEPGRGGGKESIKHTSVHAIIFYRLQGEFCGVAGHLHAQGGGQGGCDRHHRARGPPLLPDPPRRDGCVPAPLLLRRHQCAQPTAHSMPSALLLPSPPRPARINSRLARRPHAPARHPRKTQAPFRSSRASPRAGARAR